MLHIIRKSYVIFGGRGLFTVRLMPSSPILRKDMLSHLRQAFPGAQVTRFDDSTWKVKFDAD